MSRLKRPFQRGGNSGKYKVQESFKIFMGLKLKLMFLFLNKINLGSLGMILYYKTKMGLLYFVICNLTFNK